MHNYKNYCSEVTPIRAFDLRSIVPIRKMQIINKYTHNFYSKHWHNVLKSILGRWHNITDCIVVSLFRSCANLVWLLILHEVMSKKSCLLSRTNDCVIYDCVSQKLLIYIQNTQNQSEYEIQSHDKFGIQRDSERDRNESDRTERSVAWMTENLPLVAACD